MSQKLTGVRGMPDILPEEIPSWQHIESVMFSVLRRYGYREIRLPLLERTELFKRSIGEITDIVEKEMYSFEDRNGDGLTLRPEMTAGIVRSGINHGLFHNQKQKLWSIGPMFRYEKPQHGRSRQFHQFDVEAFGFEGPDIDLELLLIASRIWKELDINAIELQINSIGTPECRSEYRDVLIKYFNDYRNDLDDEEVARLNRNPMRLLDSKKEKIQGLIKSAPKITDYLDSESAEHFSQLQELLLATGLNYKINPRLVRGLDYYTRTVFEWTTDKLGSQSAVCAGGRYDGLVQQLGGKSTNAVGWALGMERLVELYQIESSSSPEINPDLYLVAVGEKAFSAALTLAEELRNKDPKLSIEVNCGGGSFKVQFKRADKSGAKLALILGEEELHNKKIGIKPLRDDRDQQTVSWTDIATSIKTYL
ncbi:MAG: histidine--tRNA ligase [Pseudomonadota bacterium]|nr:histidine--tRNA ligase [Pseudomonadota bacterium]